MTLLYTFCASDVINLVYSGLVIYKDNLNTKHFYELIVMGITIHEDLFPAVITLQTIMNISAAPLSPGLVLLPGHAGIAG